MKASTIQKNLAALLTGVSLLTLSACASAPMGTPSIKSAMQQMKNTHQAEMNSDNLADFKMHVAGFKKGTHDAALNRYRGTDAEQAMYAEGMKKLDAGLMLVEQNIASGNLTAAKAELNRLLEIRNQYHKVLKK